MSRNLQSTVAKDIEKAMASRALEDKALGRDATIPKSFTIYTWQYDWLLDKTASNKLLRRKPDSASEIVREAISMYIAADSNVDGEE